MRRQGKCDTIASETPVGAGRGQEMEAIFVLVTVVCAGAAAAAAQGAASGAGSGTDAGSRAAVTAAVNGFAYDFYRVAGAGAGNLVLSPVSAAAALALTWYGADGATAQQLGSALHLPPDRQRVLDGFAALHHFLQIPGSRAGEEGMELHIANKLFAQRGVGLRAPFQRAAARCFRADAEQVDFARDPEVARRSINHWVEAHTHGKISDLFGPGSPSADSLLVLVNAVYFKAGWERPFQEKNTRLEPFYLSPTTQVDVPTMHIFKEFMYADLSMLNAKVVALNYMENLKDPIRTKMVIILPNSPDGLRNVEKGLYNINLNTIPLLTRDVNMSLPKFRIEASHDLKDMLTQLGVTDLFSRNANLRGLTDQPSYVSTAVQKTFIEVNENGTEASAVTGMDYILYSGPPPRVNFKADRPFLFYIMRGDVIVFMGRITDPRAVMHV